MSVFAHRTLGYKVGVVFLCLATGCCLWGFAAPYWANVKLITSANFTQELSLNLTGTTVSEGLWTYCIQERYSDFKCRAYDIDGYPWWFHLARGLTGVGMLGLIFTCLRALATNCCTKSVDDAITRSIELLAIFLGLLSAGGCVVWGYFRILTSDTNAFNGSPPSEALWIFYSLKDYSLGWAFYLTAAGSGVAIISGFIIAIGNKLLKNTPHEGQGRDQGQGSKVFQTDESRRGPIPAPRGPRGQDRYRI